MVWFLRGLSKGGLGLEISDMQVKKAWGSFEKCAEIKNIRSQESLKPL